MSFLICVRELVIISQIESVQLQRVQIEDLCALKQDPLVQPSLNGLIQRLFEALFVAILGL